eukprot:TRINITY_DN6870_c0_g1_i2.p1 TRINITY_DN6870_c0_g1~~TRINITY_DN6870_c0_g1_i2.p1  ORF type:complete len:565 (-),score=120.52 TRINITY_DN6870_c0_g1_i2:36-1730(-)
MDIVGFPSNELFPEPEVALQQGAPLPALPYPALIVSDSSLDPELHFIKAKIMQICQPIQHLESRARVLACLVCTYMGGCRVGRGGEPIEVISGSLKHEETRKKYPVGIPLGKISFGERRERSLLFKFLSDRLEIPCKLTRKYGHQYENLIVWNEVIIGQDIFIVDLLHNPALYLSSSPEAYMYTNMDRCNGLADYPPNFQKFEKSMSSSSSALSRWIDPEINLQNAPITLLHKIGSGRFANVYKAKLGGFVCAVKILEGDNLKNKETKREIKILANIKNHDHIIRFFGNTEVEGKVGLLFELWDGTLRSEIQKVADGKRLDFTRSEIKMILGSVAKGLKFLHTLPIRIVHRDVKSQNILVQLSNPEGVEYYGSYSGLIINKSESRNFSPNPSDRPAKPSTPIIITPPPPLLTPPHTPKPLRLKSSSSHVEPLPEAPSTPDCVVACVLSDFGLSKELNGKKEVVSSVGTVRWMAPEIHKECPYDVQVDIWSFGMLMYELFSWKLPYHNTPVLDVKEKVLAGHVPDTNGLSENFGVFKELYENCIKHNPTERWTADQCLDFLNKIS